MIDIPHPPRLALVGDRSPTVEAHRRIPLLLDALAAAGAEPIEAYWMASATIDSTGDLAGFDGIWVVPGSPYLHRHGVLLAIEAARTSRIPFLGTCGGFQHMLLELARNVCGLPDAEHAESHPEAAELLVAPLACKLFGEEATVVIAGDTVAASAMGAGPTTERFFCRFGLDQRYEPVLEAHGLVVSGRDDTGEARVAELSGHPFFVGTLFQPELSSDPSSVHPLVSAFGDAVRAHADLPTATAV